ncbi:MAG: hypothetical protein GXO83_11790 [Chlorobi bacterium]|nr:hypothetical protein [Chlorobiota bacterium]
MKIFFKIIAFAGLIILFIPALLHYSGTMSEETMKEVMLLGTFVWFAGAIPWLGQKEQTN